MPVTASDQQKITGRKVLPLFTVKAGHRNGTILSLPFVIYQPNRNPERWKMLQNSDDAVLLIINYLIVSCYILVSIAIF